jgi:hypothetical protein
MRRIVLFVSAAVLLIACTPPPEKVCAHLDELDRADPNLKLPSTPKRSRPSKLLSCTKGLTELKAVDPKLYDSAAKCIGKATKSADAWDCWVLDHISDKQPEKKAKLIACGRACTDEQDNKCLGGPVGKCRTDDACVVSCSIAYEDCVTRCQFE